MKNTFRKNKDNDTKKIIVIAEHLQDKIRTITWELMNFAFRLSEITGNRIVTVLPWEMDGQTESSCNSMVQDIMGNAPVDMDIICLSISGASHPDSLAIKESIATLLEEVKPSFVIAGHTSQGLDIAPGLAAKIGGIALTGVTRLIIEDEQPAFVQPLFKGRVNGVTALEKGAESPVVITIQPGVFSREKDKQSKSRCTVITKKMDMESLSKKKKTVKYAELLHISGKKSRLDGAKVIIAAGRGIGSPDNIEDVKELAECFPESAVAGSRPLIDMGWMTYEQQVGITGAVVEPELYMAVGISGSSQHIAGMKDAGFIVSVNKDPNAAIFNVSDICIVEDGLEFVRCLRSLFA
ncbi:putative Protein fixB [Desulfamplus magnetovallimortis]|uniref:Uncharacterized protein n=1 Tax=Desulfamplus magnetovallimortis TaxID=1246637 RepID=A0A1W1H7F2_9BACT|nr:electron transfer flavoprotein subunit alpha/FixB family protein [Desulfamplus magnetovallimortis]SLM28397.1 putative Protein fixB [Desulfamplus magnetovallimortis]